MNTNVGVLTQQLMALPYPEEFTPLALEALSYRPYKFKMVFSNSQVNRVIVLSVHFEGDRPKFMVTEVNKVAVAEPFEFMGNYGRCFETAVRPVPKAAVEDAAPVHIVSTMKAQKDILANHVSKMLNTLYTLAEAKITQNDGINVEGYFVALEGEKYQTFGFKFDMDGTLKVLDFKSRSVIGVFNAVTMKSGYSPEGRAEVAAHEEARKKEEMTNEEKRRSYSKAYYERQQAAKKKSE